MTDYTNPPLRPVCEVPQDGIVVLYPGVSAKYEDCEFPEGTTFRAYYSTQGLEMDTDTQQPKTQELQVEPPAVPAIDPAQLQQLGAENPMLAIALAAVAVLGGGAAWKHYGKASEMKHEQAMKALEIQASAQANVPTVQPPPCQAADAATQAKIAGIEARLAKAEQAAVSIGGLPDDLEQRLEAIEKKIKRSTK